MAYIYRDLLKDLLFFTDFKQKQAKTLYYFFQKAQQIKTRNHRIKLSVTLYNILFF